MEKVSLDDMRLFVSVVQAGSLHLASELTGVPISRLSRRMTQLEQALGSKLMDRGKKGVTLNDLGQLFSSGRNKCCNLPNRRFPACRTA